jgi:hypothetical protein
MELMDQANFVNKDRVSLEVCCENSQIWHFEVAFLVNLLQRLLILLKLEQHCWFFHNGFDEGIFQALFLIIGNLVV